jgi:sporulation protein YabP
VVGGFFMMNMEERKNITTNVIQNVILENRGKLSISGVLDVFSFDDQVVIVETELGLLTVKGENLRINKLSIDTSEVIVEGNIMSLAYSDRDLEKKGGSLLGKIFK